MPVTQPADVIARADRALTPADLARVPVLIEDVELVIAARFRDAGGVTSLEPGSVRTVTAWAVLDLLARKSTGPTSTEVSVDDGRLVNRFETASGPSAASWIRDEWWDLLAPGTASEAFSIRPHYVPGEC